MTINKSIAKLRLDANLSQEQFAQIFGVSRQSVQKWESGASTPELKILIKISKYFGVSLDNLILNNDDRVVEEMHRSAQLTPKFENLHTWDFYITNTWLEYDQCIDEGLDIGVYKDVFAHIGMLPNNEIKKKFCDILFEIVINAEKQKDYKYTEPSDLESIKELRKPYEYIKKFNRVTEDKVHGAWIGRICGCFLGKPIEGIRTCQFIPFLKETNNYPLHRYIYNSDLTEEICNNCTFPLRAKPYADTVDGMPVDDDTNYTVLYQEIIENYGKDFTPYDVSRAWLKYQTKDAYCTAERVAYRNFIKGYVPPQSAIYKNPYREWIGAQIRADYFGYINPGNPELAAEMAWRDACISHTKNGIYGEMFVAAMLAIAATTDNIEDIILGGLAQIPHTSRLYEDVTFVVDGFKNGISKEDCFKAICKKYDEYTHYGWTHTIPNAMIVTAALLYGKGDYGNSICMAVEACFDTDCNGATVGSILGMANGIEKIPGYWIKPINDTLHTSIFDIGTVKISDRVKMTMKHIEDK